MNNRVRLAASMTMCLAAAALASPPLTTPSPRRQLIDCMNKQMSMAKTLSYNDATKLCKDQLKTPVSSSATADNASTGYGVKAGAAR